MDFVAIDFETANQSHASVCAAGWAVVRGGQVVENGSWLCRPPSGHAVFAPRNIGVHGITPARVARERGFAERAPGLLARIAGMPVVAHNAAFDLSVLRQALAACGLSHQVGQSYCTLRWAKRLLRLPAHNLPAVCSRLGVVLGSHHEAGADALAAAEVALRLAEEFGARTLAEIDATADRPAGPPRLW